MHQDIHRCPTLFLWEYCNITKQKGAYRYKGNRSQNQTNSAVTALDIGNTIGNILLPNSGTGNEVNWSISSIPESTEETSIPWPLDSTSFLSFLYCLSRCCMPIISRSEIEGKGILLQTVKSWISTCEYSLLVVW